MPTSNVFHSLPFLILATLLLGIFTPVEAGLFWRASGQYPRTQAPVKKILRAEDFTKPGLPRGSGLEDVKFFIEINPKLPPYEFHLIPNRDAAWSREPRLVGRIEIFSTASSDLLQTIDVSVEADVTWFTGTFSALDVNFDGYLDIFVCSDHGAKWGSYLYWLFDPESGRFITNGLTQQLGKLMANTRDWNSEARTLHLGFLSYDQGRIGETYRIENGRLTLIEVEERLKDCDENFREVTTRIIDGKRDRLILEPCNRFMQNIAEGQVHQFDISLEVSQSLLLTIETGNIDLVITLIAPQGETLVTRELTCDQDGTKISMVAKTAGIYRVEVRPAKEHPDAGVYFIWLQEGTASKHTEATGSLKRNLVQPHSPHSDQRTRHR